MTDDRRTIELLSPAKDLECGKAAIDCGADAVYIGAPQFGARVAAGNSIDHITELVKYAHRFGAKVYVALNTILYDNELDAARDMALRLYHIGVDALITQDMALRAMNLPIALNASTQMDIRTPEKALWLSELGYDRLILARELDLKTIQTIHNILKTSKHPTDLEVFVHGALCVSYSGQCYASQYCFNRSANRGACAQFCRMAFDLEDAEGNILMQNKHLLSLKDLNRSASLEELMDAGVSSFKIEGRLKGKDYVKNVTAYYRNAIDEILKRRTEYRRSSAGISEIGFRPNLNKSFNRGFTDYFLHGRKENVASFNTPKSIGEFVGRVKSISRRELKVAGVASFHNGDGLCFFDSEGKLHGFRVNRVENNVLYLAEAQNELRPNVLLYRNYDAQFVHEVEHAASKRLLGLSLRLSETPAGFLLIATDVLGRCAELSISEEKQRARNPQRERIVAELSKLGGTVYFAESVTVDFSQDYFLPVARVAEWRRRIIEQLYDTAEVPRFAAPPVPTDSAIPLGHLDYSANVANRVAHDFYLQHGATSVDKAFELAVPNEPLVMTCRHCLKFSLGFCPRYGRTNRRSAEPLFLRMTDGRRFRLDFDCQHCQMKIYATD